ncbi:MAG: c-type cytochrome [Ectothiorhodospiraceae bacterium]|nr:c-type cytochrome [Ectothiorhodospiraceae bacterium]
MPRARRGSASSQVVRRAATAMLALAMASSAAAGERERAVVVPTGDFGRAEPYEAMAGGAATSRKKADADAFSHPSANLSLEGELEFKVGNALFRRLWVGAPASTGSADGLGPLYNARSCQRCHLKDGRGHPPRGNWPDDDAVSMVLRLMTDPTHPPTNEARAQGAVRHQTLGDPVYGGQLQDFAAPGLEPEGRLHLAHAPRPVALADGEVVTLQQPLYRVDALAHGPMAPGVTLSPRVAPPMIGLGLLEMIAEADIVAGADPDDRDGDGISGRVSRVVDRASGQVVLGRFGWKAESPSIRQQSAAAFASDLGLSTTLFPAAAGDCTPAQEACIDAAGAGESPAEVDDESLRLVSHYARNLAVPVRRMVADARVLRGKAVFYGIGCVACHRPKFVTAVDSERPEHSHQLVWPYTDLLLHDMGEALADGASAVGAAGREWRTPPLWGIGLTATVSGHTRFLHDGRARDLLEAVLWHGGEGASAREAFRALSSAERRDLLAFLESL